MRRKSSAPGYQQRDVGLRGNPSDPSLSELRQFDRVVLGHTVSFVVNVTLRKMLQEGKNTVMIRIRLSP